VRVSGQGISTTRSSGEQAGIGVNPPRGFTADARAAEDTHSAYVRSLQSPIVRVIVSVRRHG
jgi:hypothetical protein